MAATTIAPNYPYYNCDFVRQLPFEGAEILILAAVFMFIVVNFAVSFFSVVAKQLWPSALDPVVANRLIAIQKMFPNIVNSAAPPTNTTSTTAAAEDQEAIVGAIPVKEHIVYSESGEPIKYDQVVSAEPYIAGKSVDEDLLVILANNDAFGTVSSYCTCTVRGYAMLSTMLLTAGMCLSFMWIHNVLVDPSQNTWLGKIALLGYCLCFLTGITMCGPEGKAVYRNANIWLSTNIPLNGTPRKMLSLHGVGIVGFCLLPMIGHLLYALFNKDKMPNYHETMSGIGLQLLAAVFYGLTNVLHKWDPSFTELMSKKYGIAGECAAVLASVVSFVNYESYATGACAGQLSYYNGLLVGAMVLPFAFVARHFCWAPTGFTSPPSLLLSYQGTPVAQVGPAPAIAFCASTFNPDGVTDVPAKQAEMFKELPRVKLDADSFKM